MNRNPTAIIADDEALLATALVRDLQRAWPELEILATAGNGNQAVDVIFEHTPDIAFLDIKMPGLSGIEVAQTIIEDWPEQPIEKPQPHIVFVTAFDDYAVEAFAAAAIDYVLKPVKPDRLATTIERLHQRLQQPQSINNNELGAQIRQLLASEATPPDEPIRMIRANVRDVVKMIPVSEVILFESADKYVTVYTEDDEALIREPLKRLLPQLNQNRFAQIHRGAIVNLDRVEAAVRDETGKITLRLVGHSKQPVVSRLYRHLFQAM